MLPLLRERVEARKDLVEQKIVARLSYLELEQELIVMERDRIIADSRLAEVAASIAGTARQRDKAHAEFRRDRLAELAGAEARAASMRAELIKAEQRAGQQNLTAPVDGHVQELAVHTVGGVVTPAQPILVIVPDDSLLEVEAQVLNKDIGFVAEGQPVEIKLEAFPFTRYGLIEGAVLDVSSDAVEDERLGLVYTARIGLDRATIDVDGQGVRLAPGMAVTAEIKTGSRRLIEYVLGPLLQAGQESLRER